jgi:hypothetical protein
VEIAERLEVPKVKFTPGPLPSQVDTTVPERVISPSPDNLRRAAEIAAEIGDEKLRETVQKAVSLALARGPEPEQK